MSNEQIAHDLAVAWAAAAITKQVTPKTEHKSMVEEYQAAYAEALEKLNTPR